MTVDIDSGRIGLIEELENLRSRLLLLSEAEDMIKDAEKAIIHSDRFSRSILDSINANIAVLNDEGMIINVNESWIKFELENGISSLDKVETGVNYFVICENAHGAHSEGAKEALNGLKSLLSGNLAHFELEYPCDSPDVRRWFMMRATGMDIDGRRYLVVAHFDITARKLAEEAVQNMNRALEERVKARTRELERSKAEAELYLDVMSHDIANINHAMLGYLEMVLERTDVSTEIRQLISRPLELARRSSDLIARVKKLRMVSAGRNHLIRMDLGKSLSSALQQFRSVPGWHVEIKYRPVSDLFVMANDLLPEIFSNIIGNAIKHSNPDRGLEINILTDVEHVGGKKMYRVAISDNGTGIPDQMKGNLFGPVSARLSGGGRRGIGLIIVKNLVDIFQGTISVRDRVEGDYHKGSLFIVDLPAAE